MPKEPMPGKRNTRELECKWFSLVSYRSSRTSCNAQVTLSKIKSECESNFFAVQRNQISQATPNVINISESLSANVSIN